MRRLTPLTLAAVVLTAPLAMAQTAPDTSMQPAPTPPMQTTPDTSMQTMPNGGMQAAPQSETGARPGNEIGTRSSLPRSSKASNINAADTHSVIAPTPPEPAVGPDAGVRALLASASQSIASGQTGQGEAALEQAETQILQRSVPATQTNYTSHDPVVAQIDQARQALGDHNKAGARQIISQILASNAPELSDD